MKFAKFVNGPHCPTWPLNLEHNSHQNMYSRKYEDERQVFLNLVQNKYTLNNDFLSLNSEEGTFWQFLQPQKDYFSNSNLNNTPPISVSFLGQVTLREYEVNYYSFWEFIGQLGGFYEILELLGMFFIGFYNQNLLNTDLLNWYQTNTNQGIENRCNQFEPHDNLSDRNNDRDQNPE